MADLIEIRWHGRGGQGAKTAALLFGEALLEQGKYIQAFPEYGPERMGAPVQAFNRISDFPILLHCHITEPSIVVVLDTTLINKVNVLSGLSLDGILIVNTHNSPLELREKNKIEGRKIFTIDASKISKECLGQEIPNTTMMGALIKISGLIKIEELLKNTQKKLEKKFKTKLDVIEGNLNAIKRAYEEVIVE
ncbi:MAG: 2-oxoacid:acceptor oxidoreductase family protein [bacterium]